ncbi:DUF732 domain-containing protein [Mycolicibacterium setense]
MKYARRQPPGRPAGLFAAVVLATVGLLATFCAPPARADQVAYLLNVTVRPGYNFANAADALGYGRGICDEIATGRSYGKIVNDVKTDLATADDYQASYLIAQAANELCPAQIWQLRNSAAGYPGTAAVTP